MPRRLFKRYMPDPSSIREHKSLQFLGTLLHDPNLWHLNRHSVARAMAVGLFAAFIPIPLQMLLAAVLAISVRGNMPIAISLVWLTNPITMPVVFICTYMTGAWLMNVPPRSLPDNLTWEWISGQLSTLWQPFLLGSVVLGVVLGALAYCLTMAYWRWWVAHQWKTQTAPALSANGPANANAPADPARYFPPISGRPGAARRCGQCSGPGRNRHRRAASRPGG